MSVYIYKAKDGPGRTLEGEIKADSLAAAIADVDAMGYSPVWVREKTGEDRRSALRRRRVTPRDVTVFTRQLASLTKSGVPILRALSTIREQSENAAFSRIVGNLESVIRDGGMLSDALARHPRLFPELYINLVRSGEWGGVLDTVLLRLAEAREQEEETRRKVQAAMAYPTLVVAVGAATVFALLTLFLPRVVELFRDYADLPLPTRILIAVSDLFHRHGYWLLLGAVLLGAIFKRVTARDSGRALVDRGMLHLPLLGRLVLHSDVARFARTLALLINSGVAIDKALELSGSTLRNSVLRAEIDTVRRATVQQGATLSFGLRRTRHFPAFVANMTAVGEESGRLDESLSEIASFYEKEVEQQSRMMTSLIEPALILVVGGVVGFIVAAMLLPIFKLGSTLR